MLAALFLTAIAVSGAAPGEGMQAPPGSWARDALTRALAASEDIADPFHHAQTLAEIAEAEAIAGDPDGARTLLARAVDVAQKVDEDALASWALHDIALAYIKANELNAAESTAEKIHDLRLHDVVLAAVVDARRGARDLPGAQTTARHIRDTARQGQSLRAIAILQATEGHFSDALVTARSIQHSQVNALAIGDVAAALARDRGFEEARSLVLGIRETQYRARGLVEVATGQASTGDVTGALTVVNLIEDKLARAEALARIAALHASTIPDASRDLFTQALASLANARGTAVRRCDTLIEIARAQVIAGDIAASTVTLKRVFAELSKVKNESERLNLLSRIAPVQARAGDFEGALSTAMRAEDGSLRPLLVRDIAASQAEKGDVAGAVAAARSLDDRPAAAAALFGILRVQSQAHDSAGMQETMRATLQAVRFIGNAELRAGALGSLAATHVLEGDVTTGQALFTEAMNTAATLDGGQQRAAVYARIADSLADRHRVLSD